MIRTSTQLKAKVRNLSHGDNNRAKILIRNFVMERSWKECPYRHIEIILF